MSTLKRWLIEDAIFRGSPGRPFHQTLSCGFLNKNGLRTDVTDERYGRFAMIYLIRGKGHYSDSFGQQAGLRAGDVFFRCPDRRHTNEVDPASGWHEAFVSVRSDWYELFRRMEIFPAASVHFHLGTVPHIPEQIHALMQRLRTADTPGDNAHVEFDIAALMRWTLTQALESRGASSFQLEQLKLARERIRSHASTRLDLEKLLDGIGLSYSRLRSLFREAYGTSPGEYRVQVRIDQACSLLEATGLELKEIADQLGYSDAFAFSKQFKQRVGVSPSTFRERRLPRRKLNLLAES
ncbi:helix-turn-helix transcriptional regulator [Ruficoccus amylovorans]|uniref:Helix-turn-helix transcriptional regulator n=1 Tax=Ruficoccus amylovorans TaxID=1804625 RepID=A0A842HKP7_9BACT|nr:AraC family transcriptional regulator [Ruficoccus amylovorans]MBC2596244.1 helix-turn-helix transcriptional regulator [Ruficoccus amylovorans]